MYSQIASNKRKTLLLIAGFVAVISTLGYVFSVYSSSPSLFYWIGLGSLFYSLITYWMSDRIALGISGAQPIAKKDAPQLYRLVENLSIAAGLPMPRVYIIDDPSPNAFATGRNPKNAAVAVTSGLLDSLDKPELEGVLAHELGHVGNYDIRLMSAVTAMVSLIAFISDFLLRITIFGDDEDTNPVMIAVMIVAAILAPLIAVVIQLAVSRQREYLADATAALITRYPKGLEDALLKISKAPPMERSSSATAHLYISNPLGGGGVKGGIAKLFSTHPPIEERINRLKRMESTV